MRVRAWAACWALVLAASAACVAEVSVRQTEKNEGVIVGKVDLPSKGLWRVRQPAAGAGVSQVYLLPPDTALRRAKGKRQAALERRWKTNNARYRMWQLRRALEKYAKKHDGVAPASLDQLLKEHKQQKGRQDRLKRLLTESPWAEDKGKGVKGPFYFLIPNVRILDAKGRRLTHEGGKPLVLELRPYADDGEHWVLTVNGRAVRRKIDRELLKKHNLLIGPVLRAVDDKAAPPRTYTYTIAALSRGPGKAAARLSLYNMVTAAKSECVWNFANATPGKPGIRTAWARARAAQWIALVSECDAPVLRTWLALQKQLYGTEGYKEPGGRERPRRRLERSSSVFNVLGGRAAVRETLQMQLLMSEREAERGERAVPVSEIQGVQVRSHPFEKMLAGKEGGRLPLADVAPLDRFFVYFARPVELPNLLDSGGLFMARVGDAFTRNRIDYDLAPLYKARLGVGQGWSRLFLQSGVAQEMAIIASDLFVIDGTDLTIVIRVQPMRLAQPFLARLGVKGLDGSRIVARRTRMGTTAWWAARGDLLMLSTNEQELKRVIALFENKGKGSLGRSPEFRYMLTQVPLKKTTFGYAYFSDPFIRRLVGPAMKIGQSRRIWARAEMEALAAGALLYRADGHTGVPTLGKLIQLGYAPKTCAGRGYSLGDGLVPACRTWGTPARMKTLLDNPVTMASKKEAEAYRNYMREYTSFWRQFFDPIAMRLDLSGDNAAELTTFILPLLDSDLYDEARKVMATRESGKPMLAPTFEPRPVLMLSLNLSRKGWLNVLAGVEKELVRRTRLDPAILDHLGPSVHFAVMDADPIISLGSGDVLGAFGGRMGLGGEEMVMIPIIVSGLIRPCKMLIEVDDPKQVRAILKRAAAGVRRRQRGWFDVDMQFYEVTGRDAWVYSIDMGGVIKLRFGVEVQDRYLVISNLPWAHGIVIKKSVRQALNGAGLRVNPGLVVKQLAALHTSAQDNQRAAAVQGMAYLLPLMLAGARTPDKAAAQHAALFGFKPTHPAGGRWEWQNGELTSSLYGSLAHPRQPEYEPGKRGFGLLGEIEGLSLNMQLEDSGLRTLLRWTWRNGK